MSTEKWKLLGVVGVGVILVSVVVWSTVVWPSPVSTQSHDVQQVTVLADCPDDAGVKPSHPVKLASLGTVVDPLVFASGVSGTYTVPRGYVVALSAVASTITDAGGGTDAGDAGIVGATVTITPNGPAITDSAVVTQPPILIPSGAAWSLSRPAIQGSANEMGAGTVIVFSGTVTYTIVMSLGGS